MSKTDHSKENLDNTDIVKMIIALQEKSNGRRNTINVNPMTAFISLGLVILVLIQFMIGFGMWSIQDRLKRYDAYENRISDIEQSLVRFESVPSAIEDLVNEIRTLTQNINIDEKAIEKRLVQLETDVQLLKISVKK